MANKSLMQKKPLPGSPNRRGLSSDYDTSNDLTGFVSLRLKTSSTNLKNDKNLNG